MGVVTADLTDLSVQELEALRMGLDSIPAGQLSAAGMLGNFEGLRYKVIMTRYELKKSIEDAEEMAKKDEQFEARRREYAERNPRPDGSAPGPLDRFSDHLAHDLGYNSLADPNLDQMPL